MRSWRALAAVIVLTAAVPAAGSAHTEPPAGQVLAGAAVVDSTWHVGASSGQYSGDPVLDAGAIGPYDPQTPERGVEPYNHSTISRPSYGLQGRESVRALVVQGSDGQRMALVSNDLYIPQDLVNRRVAGLLAEHDALVTAGVSDDEPTGITAANLTVSVSHSHSSPYYSTPAWGPWAFQDSFDIRYFEFIAERMARAVINASQQLVPARVGGSVSYFDALQRHSFGPTVADDGSPAGYPHGEFPDKRTAATTENEKLVFVIAVDDISVTPPKPLATWVALGLHPEMLDGNDLLAAEYVNTMMRNVDRQIGGITLFSQENTGTVEPARSADSLPPHARAEYSHRQYAQIERGARLLADKVIDTRNDIAAETPEDPFQFSPFATHFPVKVSDLRVAPPNLRAVQTVSNCRTERQFQGDLGVPLIGLPDCNYDAAPVTREVVDQLPMSPSVVYDELRAAGVPVPDNIGVPSFIGLQETPQVHLQAIRLGDIAITVCPCEQWGDQARNIRTRLNRIDGDLWHGFDWTEHSPNGTDDWCTRNADTTWSCYDPRSWRWSDDGPTARQIWTTKLAPISDRVYKRMLAQIHNDASGWDELTNLHAETDPIDPEDIKGNFTREELDDFAYGLVMPIGMTNDYMGYLASYREYARGDHYRKALTGLGPHSQDFMATRLSRMAANLNGASLPVINAKDIVYSPEDLREHATAQAIGQLARGTVAAYERTLPANGGTAAITQEPSDVTRFSAASVSWIGGDSYTDTPDVRVQRKLGDDWIEFANGQSEVQYRTWFPQLEEMPAWRAGQFPWRWTATFEAFGSDIPLRDAVGTAYTATPAGEYRFVIDGTRRGVAGLTSPYHFESASFTVSPRNAFTVNDIRKDGDGTVSFTVGGTNYPDTYTSPFPFIDGARSTFSYGGRCPGCADQVFCLRCSFRPWADFAAITATVTINGSQQVSATLGADGRYHTSVALGAGDTAFVASGGIVDAYGQVNPNASSVVG